MKRHSRTGDYKEGNQTTDFLRLEEMRRQNDKEDDSEHNDATNASRKRDTGAETEYVAAMADS